MYYVIVEQHRNVADVWYQGEIEETIKSIFKPGNTVKVDKSWTRCRRVVKNIILELQQLQPIFFIYKK